MSERAEVSIALDNKQLRDQWETRANELKEKEDLERSRVKKSALNGLFQEWNYRLQMRQGVPAGEKKAKDMSDFRKYVVTAPTIQQDEKAMQAKFKIVTPPPRKVAPPPPPPPKREPRPAAPAAPRKERPPPEEKKPARAPQATRAPSTPQPAKAAPSAVPAARPVAYKDDLSQATWNESWKILKPLMDMERSMGMGGNERKGGEFNVHKYRCVQQSLEKTWSASAEWNKSCPMLKNNAHKDYPKRQKPWRSAQQPESFKSSDWAEAWKMQNPVFQQQAEAWGQEWSGYHVHPKDKTGHAQYNKDIPQGWEESWMFFKTLPKKEGEHLESEDYWKEKLMHLYKKGMFCPGWSESWKSPEMQNGLWEVTEMGNNRKAFEHVYLKDWAESWRCCRQHNWCKESSHQRYRFYFYMMSKRMTLNNVKTLQLQEQTPTEWTESWKLVKGQTKPKDTQGSAADVDVSFAPLHLQFHMLNTKFPGWAKSWCVAKAPSGGDDGAQPNPQWRNSWKLSDPNPSAGDATKQSKDVMCWSNQHKNFRYMQSDTEQVANPCEWSASWQTVKPPPKSETEPQPKPTEGEDHPYNHVHLCQIPLLDWNDSWRFANKHASAYTVSLSRWSKSWKFSNPNDVRTLTEEEETYNQRRNGPRYPEISTPAKEPQIAEWGTSWKYMTPDSPKPDMPREDSGEWGESWRVSNPQLYLKKEAWSEQDYGGDLQYLCLQLSFISKEDKKVLSPELSQSEWSESWRFLKQEAEHKRE